MFQKDKFGTFLHFLSPTESKLIEKGGRGTVDISKKYISLSRMTSFIAEYPSNSIRGAADAFGVVTGPRG